MQPNITFSSFMIFSSCRYRPRALGTPGRVPRFAKDIKSLALLLLSYILSAAFASASLSRFSSSGVSFAGSTAIVSLLILPVNLNGTW